MRPTVAVPTVVGSKVTKSLIGCSRPSGHRTFTWICTRSVGAVTTATAGSTTNAVGLAASASNLAPAAIQSRSTAYSRLAVVKREPPSCGIVPEALLSSKLSSGAPEFTRRPS